MTHREDFGVWVITMFMLALGVVALGARLGWWR